MSTQKLGFLKKYSFEFLTIFIGIFAAFALDRWNESRKGEATEINILTEINKGLSQDIIDIGVNEDGHKAGLRASLFFGKLLLNKPQSFDSVQFHYFNVLRDFISVQNNSGYETLKSKGLDIITNDSLRTQILSLYENDYNTLRKLEEDYSELQLFETYHSDFDNVFAPNLIIDDNGSFLGINNPLKISERDKKLMVANLWKINSNRQFILTIYADVKSKIFKLKKLLAKELKR